MMVNVDTDRVITKLHERQKMLEVAREESKEAFDMKKIRHEYQVRFGRKPFWAWTKEQILAKINESNVEVSTEGEETNGEAVDVR